MDKNQKVSLGCGTLIFIALIVLIFSNANNNNVEKEVTKLRSEINELNNKIERLEDKIDELTKVVQENNR